MTPGTGRTRSRNARRRQESATTAPSESPSPTTVEEGPDAAPTTVVPLRAPRGGLPEVTDRIQPLLAWCEAAASAPTEPVAVDAERASSYRYSQRAYLLQLRTKAAGTLLVDPTAFTLPATFTRVLAGREWVLHAATQDLPCLTELGLAPDLLFDTELAARLLGMPRVGLGAVVEDTLGLRLAKEHSASDWSKRPLPESWLVYAALDVEVLVEVRDILAERLRAAGKAEWARQEFASLVARPPKEPPAEPWRSLHGVGALRSPRQLAAARGLWQRRDEIAQREDLSPHRVIRDREIVAAAKEAPKGKAAFDAALPASLRTKGAWWQAARAGLELSPAHLPGKPEPSYPPPHKLWTKKYPEVFERYRQIRARVTERAEELDVPVENLLTPSLLRQWVWEHETAVDPATGQEQLLELGARPWQAELVAPLLGDGED